MRTYALAAALVLALAGMVWAGDYHTNLTLNCQECHVMHGSQQHGYSANGGGTSTPLGGAPPYMYLLRNEINQLCLSCHDGQTFAPDVLAANGGTAVTNGRQAGALNMSNVAPYYDADGHTLGSTATAPGGSFNNAHGLECANCHAVHGRGTTAVPNPYRNLNLASGDFNHETVSYAVGTNDPTKDVFERAAGGLDHYDVSNVDFNEPVITGSGYGAWCKSCHTNFHGSSTDVNMRDQTGAAGTEWLRHPSADADIGAIGGGHSRLSVFNGNLYRPKVMSASGDWGTQGVAWATAPTNLTPSCFSCHKGHGNQNAFGLIYMKGLDATALSEQGDGANARDLCKACHGQGGPS